MIWSSDKKRWREAARWLAKIDMNTLSDADRIELAAWLEQDESNRRALEDTAFSVEVASTAVTEFLEEFRSEVADFPPHQAPAKKERIKWVIPALGTATVAALVAAIFALPLVQTPEGAPNYETIATDYGVTEQIGLPDGSTLTLNAKTSVRFHLGDRIREVDLVQGQVLFEVAESDSRPFAVRAGGRNIVVTGTVFDVISQPGHTVLTVHSGSVELSDSNETVALTRGERVTFTPLRIEQHDKDVDLSEQNSWTTGRWVFDKNTLQEVLAQIGPFYGKTFVYDKAQLGSVIVDGIFRHDRLDAILLSLSTRNGINVAEQGDTIHLDLSD